MAKDPQWLALLHIERHNTSKIAPGNFFRSKDGNINPEAELVATINSLKDPNSNTQCLFPARYEWLKSQLSEIARIKKLPCPELTTWYEAINPSRITLIFASSFVNNPASAFGHTFLRLDQDNSEDLLAYSANYAAYTQGEDALSYALKGIFGGYNGFFSVTPYYQKVKEYSDLENRDILEYHLSFTQEEVRRLVLHLWELRSVPESYYYFDENCSYKMLELLTVARPSLAFNKQFISWVIPVDTVRALGNIIESFKFRPSAQTLLKNRISHANTAQRARALEIANSNQEFNFAVEDPETLDLALELITYRKIAGSLPEALANKRAFEILSARGANPQKDEVPAPTDPKVRPEYGHKSSEISLEQGRRQNLWFTRLTARPALHDLLDPHPGYQNGAQIKFFELAFDATESDGVNIANFTALDITSLTPRDDFFTPLSWNVRTGLTRNIIRERDDSLTTYLGTSVGRSYSLSSEGTFYALLDSEIRANKHYQSDFNPGAGLRTGLLSNFENNWGFNIEGQWLRFVDQTSLNLSLNISYATEPDSNWVLKIKQEREFDRSSTIATLGYEWFFSPY